MSGEKSTPPAQDQSEIKRPAWVKTAKEVTANLLPPVNQGTLKGDRKYGYTVHLNRRFWRKNT